MVGLLVALLLQVTGMGNTYSEYIIGKAIPKGDLNNINFIDLKDFRIHEDYIYAADFKGKQVYAFDKNGQLINKAGGSGKGPGEFVHGPRIISSAGDEVFILGMMPYLMKYDVSLNYKRNTYLFKNIFSVYDMVTTEHELVFAMSSFFEEHITVYNRDKDLISTINLGFELKAGMLNEFTIQLLNNERWLFTWPYQNKFKIYNRDFSPELEFSIPGLPAESEGRIIQTKIPASTTKYRKKMYETGTFVPSGSFLPTTVVLNQDHLLVQLGAQTGNPQKALIISLKGEILQEIKLPVAGRILGYSDDELFMLVSDSNSISAYQITRSD